MRDDAGIAEFIGKLKPSLQDRIRSLVMEKNINSVGDFLYITAKELLTKNCGIMSFLDFKKALIECGYAYDKDSLEDIEQKIKERSGVKGDALLKLRFQILQRDNFRCQYCGRSPQTDPSVMLQIDHVHPQSQGGEFSERNLLTSCRECNLGKSDIILASRG